MSPRAAAMQITIARNINLFISAILCVHWTLNFVRNSAYGNGLYKTGMAKTSTNISAEMAFLVMNLDHAMAFLSHLGNCFYHIISIVPFTYWRYAPLAVYLIFQSLGQSAGSLNLPM